MENTQKDINEIVSEVDLFSGLKNSDVLVTGATGLIGSMLLKAIFYAGKKYDLGINLVGQARNISKAKSIFAGEFDGIKFVDSIDGEYDYIVHTISPTKSKYFINNPVETIQASVELTIRALEVARNSQANMVYLSSMEQYGIPYERGQIMTEDKIGIINHLEVRSSYPESKRICECLCASYASEYKVNVKIARLAQTFGTGVSLDDNRMPMQFARAVVENKDIVLHTDGNSVSNFVYITDAITGILTIMQKGEAGQAYNVCNDNETRRVLEIAELVCRYVANDKICVKIEKHDNMGYAPDVEMYLNSEKLKGLGWNPRVPMVEAYRRLAIYLGELV